MTAPTLSEAVAAFLGPIMAEYARLIEEGDPEMPVVVSFGGLGGYQHQTTLRAIKALDRAYAKAFEANMQAACRRRNRKAAGQLL